jgi:hypothetical protein
LRSLLLICADSAAFICRVSTQITGKPASANALYSLKANALNGKPFLRQNRKDRYRLGCDLDLAHHFACLIDDAQAGLFY